MKPLYRRDGASSSAEHPEREDESMAASSSSDTDSGGDSDSAHSSQSTSPVKLEPQQPRLPTRLPTTLSLNLGSLHRSDDPSPSARPSNPGIPALQLSLQSACSPPTTSRLPRQAPPNRPQPEQQRTATLMVDLLSPAFSLPNLAQPGEQLRQQCAARLGVPGGNLRYYALVEAPSLANLPPSCQRVAVSVEGSQFSLDAVEQLLRENQDLAAAAAAAAAAAGSTAGEPNGAESQASKEPLAASRQIAKVAQARVTKLESALQKEQSASSGLQQEVATLRRQLRKSEELRTRGQRALDDLKQEFEALQRELMLDGFGVQPAGTPGSARAGEQMQTPQAPRDSTMASPMASTPGEAGAVQQERLAELLGRSEQRLLNINML
ncbi:hypothetical protein N2152v2_005891 [Parachlorella kessleri]